jgi:hypothetical protein
MMYASQTVMVLKYLVKDYPIQTLYFGIANVVANGLVMLRCVLSETWFSSSEETFWLIVLQLCRALGLPEYRG